MIIGHLVDPETISKLDLKEMDEVLQVAINELTQNPVIDERLRKDPVIMKELMNAVQRKLGNQGKVKAAGNP